MSMPAQLASIVVSWAMPFGVFVLAGPFIGDGPLEIPLLVLALLIAITLSVRSTECGVDCTRETIKVRGWLRTVSVPTKDVTAVDQRRYTLVWRDADGERRTRMHAFARSRSGSDQHSRESLAQLADWVGRH
jgi:hypothetical protein